MTSPPSTDAYPMRLQKFLARAGAASRRGSEDLMTAGRVTVNGQVVRELGSKVDPATDRVCVDGHPVRLTDQSTYIMLNKPAGYLTTMDDPQGRPTIKGLVPCDQCPGLFPVGRLDFDTTGLLLFMTDGELAHLVLHPRHHVPKRYIAKVDGNLSEKAADLLRRGVTLTDGPTQPAQVTILRPPVDARLQDTGTPASSTHTPAPGTPTSATPTSATTPSATAQSVTQGLTRNPDERPQPVSNAPIRHHTRKQALHPNTNTRIAIAEGRVQPQTTTVAITITEGRKRQVKRMFAHIGHPVLTLHRASFGPLQLGDLPPAQWRHLTPAEVQALRQAVQ